jgi:septum formation protein
MPKQVPELVLASSSPFRREQLKLLQVPFLWKAPSEVDESETKALGLAPLELSRKLAVLKAQALKDDFPGALILGGDQVCCLGETIFSKPGNRAGAIEQLEALQGKTHQLITSVAFVSQDDVELITVQAEMTMFVFTLKEIETYVDRDEPFYSCGAYKLESLGIALFEKIICEDHTSIVGLPLMKVSQVLRRYGMIF